MKKLEQLPPSKLMEELENRIKELNIYLSNHREKEDIGGQIRISKSHGCPQYYYVNKKGNKNGKYIPKKNIEFVKKVAQENYDEDFYKQALEEYIFLNRMLKQYQKKSTEKINNKITEDRKFLITTATLANEEYAEKWKEIKYHGKGFEKESTEFKTTNGLRVRSKSEILIAETLEKEDIPFRYEYPVRVDKTVYPDFYCLNARTRKEYLWEHLGKVDDKEYIEHNMIKFKNYAKHGYILGDNLIITYETSAYPLNTTDILKKIEVFLK